MTKSGGLASTTLSVLGSLLVLQSATPGTDSTKSSYVDSSEQCANSAITAIWSTMPPCLPRSALVPLPLPADADVLEVIPSHVEVPRCGGVCHQGNVYHHCVPIWDRRVNRTFEVTTDEI